MTTPRSKHTIHSSTGGQTSFTDTWNTFFSRAAGHTQEVDSSACSKSAVDAAIAESSAATWGDSNTRATISPSASLTEALQLNDDSSITFISPPSPLLKTAARSNSEGQLSQVAPPATATACGPALKAAVVSDGTGNSAAVMSDRAGDCTTAMTAPKEDSTAADSPHKMMSGLRQLLSEDARVSQVLAERREAVRKRTSAGLLWVDGLGPTSLLSVALLAIAALAWGRGMSFITGLVYLLWDHGSDVVVGGCLAILITKAALTAHLDSRLRNFLDGFDDLQASVKAVHIMQEDVHRMRNVIESMQGDLEAKTAWIPKGITPPAWLPGQKRAT